MEATQNGGKKGELHKPEGRGGKGGREGGKKGKYLRMEGKEETRGSKYR